MLGRHVQSLREHGIGVGQSRLKPGPAWPARGRVTFHQPLSPQPGDRFEVLGVTVPGPLQVAPGDNEIGLCPEALQFPQHREHPLDQLPGHSPITVWQRAAEHFDQRQHSLPLAVGTPSGVEPVTPVPEEVVKATATTAGILKKTQVPRDPPEHPRIGPVVPQPRAQPQSAGVVIGGVAALAAGDAVDRMLDQPGGVGEPIEMVKREERGGWTKRSELHRPAPRLPTRAGGGDTAG